MNHQTSIEWTHVPGYRGDVWNPTTGCNKVSQGCKHCYAETMHRRLHAMGVKGYERPFLEGARPVPERLHKPLKTKTPTAYFVNSMSDLFHEAVPADYISQVFAVMALCPQHIFIVLTKRPERMAEVLSMALFWSSVLLEARSMMPGQRVDALGTPLPNVWLGTSVEDQATADERIPHLLRCPAAVRFLSCEPLLGPVDLKVAPLHQWPNGEYWLPNKEEADDWKYHMHRINGIHWVIAGGESGPKARPMHPDWARSLRDQCKAAGVPFFFKQWGRWAPGSHIDFDHNIVLVNNGERMPYSNPNWRIAAAKYSEGEWREKQPTAMHWMSKNRTGRLLDGVEHSAFPGSTYKGFFNEVRENMATHNP